MTQVPVAYPLWQLPCDTVKVASDIYGARSAGFSIRQTLPFLPSIRNESIHYSGFRDAGGGESC
jgi:hypothetical protein